MTKWSSEEKQTIIIFGLLLIIVIIVGSTFITVLCEEADSACREIGFEDYTFRMGMKYCKDNLGNLHYVEHECDWFGFNCRAREIFVGDVRVISERGN